ncbi:nose resistant to fluoxetine protein 6-like [Dermacentor albipictus]|uniref:nose resistant to fluoxetine protein 6-like n=1 Tax=Dermacentor albipictus TaxID=60249 RepID=UPI0031FC54D4
MSSSGTVRVVFACLCATAVLRLAESAGDGDVRNRIIATRAQQRVAEDTTAATRERWLQEATVNDVAEYLLSTTEVRNVALTFTQGARARPQVSLSVHASELRDASGADYDLREYTGDSRLVSPKNGRSSDKREALRSGRRRRALDLDGEPEAVWSDPEGALTRTAEWFVRKLWMPIQELAGNGALSSKCVSGLLAVYGGVRRGQLWALKFLDATGKFPSGVLTSSSPSSDPGSYAECLDIGHNDAKGLPRSDRAPPAMEGRYCSLQWAVNSTSLATKIAESDGSRTNTTSFKRIWQGVCVPSHCSGGEVEALIAKVLNGSNTSVTVSACRSRNDFSITHVQLAVICIFIVWITLIAMSTLVHFYWDRKESSVKKVADSCHRNLTVAISAVTSIKRLLLVREEKHMSAVQPLKTVSLLWIVLGMTYRARLLEHGEHEVDKQWRHGALYALATSSDLAYTTLLLLSGYAAANTVLELHRLKVGFFRRLLAVHCLKSRLTASVLFTLGVFVLYPLFVDGPAADRVLPRLSDVCQRRWGFVVVHLNNLQGHGEVCYNPLWYVSCEMQIFVALSGIVVLIRRFKRTSCILLAFIGIAALAAVSAAVVVRGYQPPVAIRSREYVRTLSEVVYLPFLHAPAFIIGVLFNNWITRVCRVSISKCVRGVFWLLSATALVWGALYPCLWTSWVPVSTAAASVLFIVGLRLVWCVAIAYVLWAATTWKSGLVRDVLGCRTVAALGRLSLGAYLCSWMIVMHGVLSARNNLENAQAFLIRDFVANTVLSYAGALLFYVVCDGPAQSLCSLLRTLVIGREAARRRQSFDECDRKVRFLSELLGMESPRTAKELQQPQHVSRTLQRFSSLKDMVLHL